VTDRPLSPVEKVKEESRGLRGDLADELDGGTDHFSETGAQLLKFHGTYQQEDRDQRRERRGTDAEPAHQFMVRCKLPGGVLTGEQYLVIDELADRYGNGTLRVTTRQGNQFHGVLKGDLKPTIRSVNDVLVTTLGACGDVVRNVVACPAPVVGGLREEVLAVARGVSDHLLPRTRAYHEIWLDGEQVAGGPPAGEGEPDPIYETRYLPRKFKIAFAFPDDNCCDVHSNDLGFLVVAERNRLAGFNVLVGGGMGRTHGKTDTYPRLADTLGFAGTGDVVEVAEAVVKVQRDHGNRSDRRHARLKYLLDKEGPAWFRDRVERQLGRPLAPPASVQVSDIEDHLGWHEQGNGRSFLGVFIENGRIRDGADRRLRSGLRRVVEATGGGVRFTPQQNLLLTDIPDRQVRLVDRILADHGVARHGALSVVRRWAMACPALPTCGLAVAEAERVLPDVIAELEGELERLGVADAALTVRMTGCPNGCARPYTADLAFVGRSLHKYGVFVGGSMLGTRLATLYADLVPRDRLVATLRPLFERYRDERLDDERFGDFCHRVGTDALRASVSVSS
jgi:sulfite reductase (ferredoxin)